MERYIKAIQKRAKDIAYRLKNAYQILFAPYQRALSQYNQKYPHPQQMIDLFEGEWMSSFPSPFQDLKAGIYPLFEDPRLIWGINQLGGMQNKKIFELGPLEGAHSYLLQKYGATSVKAIEANPKAYLKCLLVKQILKLDQVEFLFGDFNKYLQHCTETFDTCIASGVLYHMKNPIELLAQITQKCSELFLWTQYYDHKICQKSLLKFKFSTPYKKEVKGFKHTLYPFKYGSSRFWSTFIGGPAQTSCWLSRQDILDALCYFGFTEIHIHLEEVNPLLGPCFSLVAKR